MTNKILNQLSSSCKKWKTLVLISMLLTLGVGQMWGAVTLYYQKGMPAANYSASNSATMTKSSVNSNRYYCTLNLTANSSYGFYIKWGNDYYKVSATAQNYTDVLLYNYGSTNYGNSPHRVTYTTPSSGGNTIFIFDTSNNKICVSPTSSQTIKISYATASGKDSYYDLGNYTDLIQDGSSANYYVDLDLTAVKYYMFMQLKVGGSTYSYWRGTSTLTEGNSVSLYDYGTSNYGNSSDKVNFTPSAAGKYRFTWNQLDKTIKLQCVYKVTYDGNGSTSGTKPDDAYYPNGATVTVASNSGSLAKTGYTFDGWNTANDGSGSNYTAGSGTFSKTTSTQTLYARWLQAITVKANTGSSAGSMSIYFNAGSLTSFTAAEKTDWILDSYWTTADESGSKVIEYDASTGTASLVSNVSGYTSADGKWTRTDATTLYAHWKQTYTVTYNANYPASATSTSGSVPTDATEYASGATVTVKSNSGSLAAGGYTFAGWQTEPTGGTSYAAGSGTFSISEPTTLYAKWTENMRNVTISAGTGGTVDKTSASVGVATTTTVTATAYPGYRFTGWTATNCSVAPSSSASTTLSGNVTTGDATLVANFARTYAYLEGRMTVYNEERNSETHTASSKGGWDENSTRIAMDYDGTNHYFYRHTYKTPAELKAQISSNDQWFSIARSNASGSWSGKTTYHPSANTDLTTAGIGQKKAAQTSTTTYNYKFNSSTTDGYAILYFDESGVWYTLEHTLKYNGNGNTGGSDPASSGDYYDSGTNATAASNSYTMTRYSFAGWNTNQYITGTTYAVGASVPMTTNRTLYAIWTRSVTLEQEDATTEGSTSFIGKYNCATLPTITNPAKNGYEFGGWYTEEAGNGSFVINTSGVLQAGKYHWTDADGRFVRNTGSEDKPLYAKWTQTVTLNANTANHGSGNNKTATVIYKKEALSSITHCTPATGYHRVGYYTDATGGTKVLNADGSFASSAVTDYITDGKWTKAGATTLYAQYEVNTYKIHYDPNGEATGSMDDQAATWGIYPTLTSNGFTREGYTFAGWATSPTGAVVYSNGQTLSTNLTNDNNATVKLYAKWTGKEYTVTFNPRGGSGLTPTSKKVTMGSAYGTLATVTPPAGYVFDGWYTSSAGGTKVTAETLVATPSDHTLYAHYAVKKQVYFKNTLGWDKVYVTYDSWWNSDGQGAGNQGKTYHKMKLVAGTTDVYYDDIPDAVLTSWKWNIAFDNQGFCASDKKDNPTTGTYHGFNSGEAVFRYDFDSIATMFVPTNNKKASEDGNFNNVNSTQYRSTGYTNDNTSDPNYTSGYWRTYNNTYSGYTMTYQKSTEGSTWHGGNKLIGVNGTTNTFIYTLTLDANSTYYFSMYKQHAVNNKTLQFGRNYTVKYNYCTDIKLESKASNLTLNTTAAGEYIFKLELKADGHMYLSVKYPVRADDYRVVYTWNDGSAHTYESEIIRAAAGTNETISVFVHKAESPITSRSMKIQYCSDITDGVATWTDVTGATIALTDITESGVYDFIITQPASGNPTGAYYDKYTGNYYIRTAASDGGWDMYKYRPDNIMTLSEYSLTQTLSEPYSHYYCRFIESTDMDITYAVATDYSPNISGILVGDATIGGVNKTKLPASANVRFTYNEKTNALFRAYLKNAQGAGNTRFLVLHGKDGKIFNANGTAIAADDGQSLAANELLFSDLGNWVYQVELQAQPKAAVSLIARYNGETSAADRYLIGSASEYQQIIGGDASTTKYDILAVYDFKTNRLMTVWVPGDGNITQSLKDVDVLLIRHGQEAGRTIVFGTGGALNTNKVIGAIEFRYNELVGHVANWNQASREKLMFDVSFPFNVNVSDIFGLNAAYGEAYAVQKYNGEERAAKGFFQGDGTTTFWQTLSPSDVMKANVGYTIITDNDYFNNDVGHLWDNKSAGSKIYLYFPSASNVGNIASGTKTIPVPEHECKIDRTFTSSSSRTVNHKYTDSNWNMMGVPVFANITGDASGSEYDPGKVFLTSGNPGEENTFHYFYKWNTENNGYDITAGAGYEFKSMHSYMVQYAGNVTFTGTAPAPVPASVAARKAKDEHNYTIDMQLLNDADEVVTHTYVELRENACDTFALNEDVYMVPGEGDASLYSFAGNYDVAANVLSVDNQVVVLGVEVNKAGKYTFSMPSNFSGKVTLIDNFTGEHTDLSISDYEVELPKGLIDDRFMLEINIEKVTTAIDGANDGATLKDGKAHKFLQNGILYILQNGILYDAQGKRVQ